MKGDYDSKLDFAACHPHPLIPFPVSFQLNFQNKVMKKGQKQNN